MASVKEIKKIVSYSVELNEAEASAVYGVLSRVSGDRYYGQRRHTDAVRAALQGAGVTVSSESFSGYVTVV